MKTRALAPWYGSNRTLAHHVGRLLTGCEWVGVGFAGGMSEVAHLAARTVVVNDLHRHVINLARIVADERLGPRLIRELRRTPFHPDELQAAQRFCRDADRTGPDAILSPYEQAREYFRAAWMSRNGTAGTDREFDAAQSIRWDAGGGDSVRRFRSATESLREWRAALARCSFVVLDVFAFLDRCQDKPRHGVYLDPPFPGAGDCYRHKFTEADQRQLAARVAAFKSARVVLRYYRHPLIEELYPVGRWYWLDLAGGRKQTNEANPPEVLITNHEPSPTDARS